MQIPQNSLFNTHPIVVARQKQAMQESQTPGFVDLIAKGVSGVNEMQMTSSDQINDLLSGKEVNSASPDWNSKGGHVLSIVGSGTKQVGLMKN